MKYIRTYETEEKFLTDKDSTSREFRLKPTLYKYSGAEDHVHLELDDPRKHGDSTWIRLEFTRATSFSFKIGNVNGDSYNSLKYVIDWGDGTVEMNTAVQGTDGLYTFTHSYDVGVYDMELYGTDRRYVIPGDSSSMYNYKSYFSPATSVKRVIVGDSIIYTDCTFCKCSKLTSINLPEGNVFTGNRVFYNCSSLVSINLPSTLTSIGGDAFYNCSSLVSINLPSTLTSIGSQAFTGCHKLTSINLPEGLKTIGSQAFVGCLKLTSINLPEGLKTIEDGMFNSCSDLASISSYNTTAPTLKGSNMFTGIHSNGTLHIKPGATGYDAWLSELPEGWRIVEDL